VACSSRSFLRRRSRRRKTILFALLVMSITVIGVIAARVISANTVRLSLRPQISILIEGNPFTVPSGIGINQSLWRDHSLDNYGVSGHSPLNTRDSSGIVFVESNTVRNFTLFEFLAVWGQTIDGSEVVGNLVPQGDSACMAVDGQTLPTIRDVTLSDSERIELEIVKGDCSAVS
jgi:hypothetical protein